MSIKFDSTEIQDTTHIPRFVKHETVADRTLMSLPLSREDGSVLIYERYDTKIIQLQGTLIGTSQADLDSKIDTFNELFSRVEKNLDIDWNGGTLRFVATCSKMTYDRDHYNTSAVPWTAEFTISSGVGKDTAPTTALNAVSVSYDPTVSPTGQTSFSMLGSKPAKPLVTIVGNYGTLCRGIEFKNLDTGERLQITYPGGWGNSRTIICDLDAKTVTGDVVNGVAGKALNFFGVFPKMKIGTNNIQLQAGGLVNQKSADNVGADMASSQILIQSTNDRKAQSFMVPYADQTFQGVTIFVAKTGSPGTLRWEIQTDTAGAPSGSLVDGTNSKGTFTSVPGSSAYLNGFTTSGAPFTLAANTLYWLVIKADATLDGSNNYTLSLAGGDGTGIGATYPRGKARYSTDGAATWQDYTNKTDMSFRVLFGGGSPSVSFTLTVAYTKTYL